MNVDVGFAVSVFHPSVLNLETPNIPIPNLAGLPVCGFTWSVNVVAGLA